MIDATVFHQPALVLDHDQSPIASFLDQTSLVVRHTDPELEPDGLQVDSTPILQLECLPNHRRSVSRGPEHIDHLHGLDHCARQLTECRIAGLLEDPLRPAGPVRVTASFAAGVPVAKETEEIEIEPEITLTDPVEGDYADTITYATPLEVPGVVAGWRP